MTRTYERHDHAAPVIIELRRLHNYDIGNSVGMPAGIAMHVELRHQSDENSSAMEPFSVLKLFQAAHAASETRFRCSRASRSCSR